MKDNNLLVEKYRPTDLKYYVGNEQVKDIIQKYLDQNDIQNFIFYGPAGTGKTTLAKLIVKNLNCDHLYINASDENGIDTIREKVKGFASSASWNGIKVVILDEADFITINGQAALRNVIETFSRSTRFILTCNFIERIIDPIQSRCQVLKIVPPLKSVIAKRLASIMELENISHGVKEVATIVNKNYPDVRKMLNTIQLSTVDGGQNDLYLKIDESVLASNNYTKEVLRELTQTKNWIKIRQIIADSGIKDFEELYRALFEHVSIYAKDKEGLITIILNDHLHQSNFRIDKEINIMSAIAKIIETIK